MYHSNLSTTIIPLAQGDIMAEGITMQDTMTGVITVAGIMMEAVLAEDITVEAILVAVSTEDILTDKLGCK